MRNVNVWKWEKNKIFIFLTRGKIYWIEYIIEMENVSKVLEIRQEKDLTSCQCIKTFVIRNRSDEIKVFIFEHDVENGQKNVYKK